MTKTGLTTLCLIATFCIVLTHDAIIAHAQRARSAMETRQFRLNYLDCNESLLNTVKQYLSSGGKAMNTDGSNTILITDTRDTLDVVEQVLATLDQRPQQILIEARIVEIRRSDARALGINWQLNYSKAASDVYGSPGFVESSFAINMPFEPLHGGSVGYGFINNKYNLDLRLQALEQASRAKVISSPSILVVDNHRAVISQGEEFIVPKREQSTYINTQSPDPSRKPVPETYSALLKLAVVPRVVEDDNVFMSIEVTNEAFDYTREIEGFPPKLMKTAMTELLVANAQTAVIGGIKIEGNSGAESGVPLLSRIPLLGWLFRSKQKSGEKSELMIFLTPTIITSQEIVIAPPSAPTLPEF